MAMKRAGTQPISTDATMPIVAAFARSYSWSWRFS